jgi:glutathione S-transferase
LVDAAVAARLEQTWAGRTEQQRCSAWVDRQLSKVNSALSVLSDGLGEKPWFFGIHMGLADIAVGCSLAWLEFRFPDIAWRETHPNLAKFADKINSRQSFVDTAPPGMIQAAG